jgi:hypothetical protein
MSASWSTGEPPLISCSFLAPDGNLALLLPRGLPIRGVRRGRSIRPRRSCRGAIAAADFAGRRILSARDSDFFYSFTSRIIACLPLVLCRCEHYRRRCKIVAPCCGQVFPCRHCHNEATVRFCIFVPSDHGCARLAALIIRKATYLGCFNYV